MFENNVPMNKIERRREICYISAMIEKMRQAIKQAIEQQTQANTASQSAARAALVRMEIYTEDGKISPHYDPDVEALSART